jgi:two-component system response regulator PilR (NtrC family)
MNSQSRILVVDDEQSMRELLSIMLRKEGYVVVTAENGKKAVTAMQAEIFDLVITDLKMPQMDGITLLKEIKEASPDTIVIMMTAFGTMEGAEMARSLGAYDYIGKPFNNDEIRLVIQNALEKRHLRKENILLKREIESRSGFENFIGKSDSMQRIFSLIRQVADTTSTVLVSGESGTGKELVARAIHFNSSRKNHPFVTINCGALPETLLESELFGYMKGAFTGATANKQGLFEAANGGTIFLDEISATTPTLQIKLLRVLQEREFKRVGGTADIKVDVRVIAASNKDIQSEVAKGLFREDLFYRLNVIPMHLPPLRERKDDIPPLVDFYLRKKSTGRQAKTMSPDALRRLMNYRWPGNVRELENTIERLAILTTGDTINTEHLSESLKSESSHPELMPMDIPESGIDLERMLQNAERSLLLKALEMTGGVKTDAARLLGLSFRSFRHRLKKYGQTH